MVHLGLGAAAVVIAVVVVVAVAGGDDAEAPETTTAAAPAPTTTEAPATGIVGDLPADVTLPPEPAGPPPGPAADGGQAPNESAPSVAVGPAPQRLTVPPADDPEAVRWTLATSEPLRFSAEEYLADHTSDADRDRALVDDWGLVGGSLTAWRSSEATDSANLLGLMVLELPTPEAAEGALHHVAERGRGATDDLTRFAVPDLGGAIGLAYVDHPGPGVISPGEMVAFARGRYLALVLSSGSDPSSARRELEGLARQVEPDVAALS